MKRRRDVKQRLQNAPLRFTPADWQAFFREQGWDMAEMRYLTVEGEELGRPPPLPWWFRAINVATLIGHNAVLQAAKGDAAGALTPEQMAKAKTIVRQAMEDGAVGMSTGLIYRPGIYSPPEEIIELQKVAAQYGGIYATHMRNEAGAILDAIDEALRVGREAHCRVEISHFKLPRDIAQKIGGAQTTLGKVLAARAAGQEVWLDQYPYTASSTSISTMLPDWVYDTGADEAKKRLDDPEQVRKMLADMKDQYEVKRHRQTLGYAVLSSYGHDPKLDGRNLYEVAQILKLRGQHSQDVELLSSDPAKLPDVTMDDQYRAVIDICRNGGASCVFHTMDEREVGDILRCPLVSVASDSGIRDFGSGQPHPRGYGTNARVLGHYVREQKLISLEDAVRKMTSLPATAFRFNDRGLIRANYAADLTIFDPDQIIDKATFEHPHQYSQGIRLVIVNGYPVLRDEKMTGVLSGRPILGPGVKQSPQPSTAEAARSDR
jgi:N-acyl-D-amino-acid deacylase